MNNCKHCGKKIACIAGECIHVATGDRECAQSTKRAEPS